MSRKPRRLSPEERELWSHVAGTAQPLHPDLGQPPPSEAPVLRLPKAAVAKPAPIGAFRVGQAAPDHRPRHALAPPLAERLRAQPVKMDKRAHRAMTRGKLKPEARIDLHGMTLAEAHPELTRFMLRSQAAGLRLVLVITGKGRLGRDDGPIPERHGALRHQVPVWLGQAPVAGFVLQVAEAHLRHGGSGACYVYLRRSG